MSSGLPSSLELPHVLANVAPKLEGQKRSPSPPVQVIPETTLTPPHPPSLITEGIRGPFMKNTRWDVSPFPPKQQFSSEVKDKNRVCSHVYAYLCAYFRVCTECVWVCVCVYIYIRVKWPGQSWGCQANSVRGEQHPLSRPPRPLFFPLAEPQFEPQRVHSVQVVSEQPFVSNKTQVLIELQGWFVGDFSLQYNLGTHKRPHQYVVVYMNGPTGLLHNLAQKLCRRQFVDPKISFGYGIFLSQLGFVHFVCKAEVRVLGRDKMNANYTVTS